MADEIPIPKPVNKGGRPEFKPTDDERALVKRLASFGNTQDEISKMIRASTGGIDKKTLAKHFREELDTGAIAANAMVSNRLFRCATDEKKPSVQAQKFWLGCRAGWKPAGKDDGGSGGGTTVIVNKQPWPADDD